MTPLFCARLFSSKLQEAPPSSGGRVMPELTLPLITLVLGFAAGFGIREWISRRRRAIAQREYFRRHPDEGYA
jgi:hypothetical protein